MTSSSPLRLQTFFLAQQAGPDPEGLLDVRGGLFRWIGLDSVPAHVQLTAVLIFDMREPLDPQIDNILNFRISDPRGNAMAVTTPSQISLDLKGPGELGYIYAPIGFEVREPGDHRFTAEWGSTGQDFASYTVEFRKRA